MERPIESVRLTGLDGTQYEFLLSMGALRRLKKRFGVSSLQELMAKDAEEAAIGFLWEGMLDKKEGLTEDEFVNNLPAHLEALTRVVGLLLGASFPEKQNDPTAASTIPIQ